MREEFKEFVTSLVIMAVILIVAILLANWLLGCVNTSNSGDPRLGDDSDPGAIKLETEPSGAETITVED